VPSWPSSSAGTVTLQRIVDPLGRAACCDIHALGFFLVHVLFLDQLQSDLLLFIGPRPASHALPSCTFQRCVSHNLACNQAENLAMSLQYPT
jgi:hypothetical protein